MSYGMDYQGDMGGGGNYGGGGYDNNSGGGFNSGGGGGGTPKTRRAYDEQTLIPVTARMILTAQGGENGMTLQDGRELHHVKFIGAVRSHEDASTNATYSIEDGTGLVDVKQWVDANDCPAIIEMRHECMQEHVYVKVIGSLKDYDGRKTLVAHSVRRVSTSNELTHHFLEVVYSSEKYQRKQSIVGGAMPQSMAGAGGGVGFGGVQPGGGAPVAQASFGNAEDELRNQVLNFIRNEGTATEYGAPVSRGIQLLTSSGQYTEGQVRQAIDALATEGHIYSTIDDNHYSFAL